MDLLFPDGGRIGNAWRLLAFQLWHTHERRLHQHVNPRRQVGLPLDIAGRRPQRLGKTRLRNPDSNNPLAKQTP